MVIRTPIQAIKSSAPSVGKLKAVYGDTKIKALLIDMLADFVEFINVGKTFNGSQLAQTVQMVQQYFPHFNLADLKLFFDKMKLGHYGSFYDRMDGQLILEKMEEYNQDRMNEYERLKVARDKEQVKNDPIGSGYHPDVVKALKDAIGDKKPFQQKVMQPRTLNEAELFHQRCLKQFDNLYRKHGQQISTVRFLVFNNKRYTIDTFIERKIKNIITKNESNEKHQTENRQQTS